MAAFEDPAERPLSRRLARDMANLWQQWVARQASAAGSDHVVAQTIWNRQFLPDHFVRPSSPLHLWLCERLDLLQRQRGSKLNVIGPRGAAKSTIGSLAYPLRTAVAGWEPLIWIVSETRDQAHNHLENLRIELIDNARLAAAYPWAVGRGTVWRSGRLRLKNGVVIESFGIGQKLRGRRQRAHRPTLVVCDDLQSDRAMHSATLRDRDWNWFTGLLLKVGTRRTNFVHLATAIHREALALRLLRTPSWESRTFAALDPWPTRMDLWEAWSELYHDFDRPDRRAVAREFFESHQLEMESGAGVLWPAEEDLYTLMCMREDEGRATFEREKQGRPLSPEQCEWPESYFSDELWFVDWPANLQLRALAVDPSKGRDARRGDYSALVWLGIAADGVVYVEADLARLPTTELIATVVERFRQFQPQVWGVEANQYQDLLAESIATEFGKQGMWAPPPQLLLNTIPKLVRIRSLGPWLAQRRIRFRRHSPGTQLLVNQLKDFPDPHVHDDGPDALEMALRIAGQALRGSQAHDPLAGWQQLVVE